VDDLALKRWKFANTDLFLTMTSGTQDTAQWICSRTYSQADLFQNGFVCFLQMLEESISLGFRFASAIVYSVAQVRFCKKS